MLFPRQFLKNVYICLLYKIRYTNIYILYIFLQKNNVLEFYFQNIKCTINIKNIILNTNISCPYFQYITYTLLKKHIYNFEVPIQKSLKIGCLA